MPEVPNAGDSPNVRQTRKNPRDFTGKKGEELAELNEVEVSEASKQMAMATAEAKASKDDVVDYTDADTPLPEVEQNEVEVEEPYKVIRVNSDIEQMTFGREVYKDWSVDEHGAYTAPVLGPLVMKNFEAGRRYRVPYAMYVHLRDRGYLYDY